MNWYARCKIAAMLRHAEPHYYTACPACGASLLADLLWEQRADDPTLQAYDLEGQPLPVADALRDSSRVSRWESRERFDCPNCGKRWFTNVTRRIRPEFDSLPTEEVRSVDSAPGEEEFHSPIVSPV